MGFWGRIRDAYIICFSVAHEGRCAARLMQLLSLLPLFRNLLKSLSGCRTGFAAHVANFLHCREEQRRVKVVTCLKLPSESMTKPGLRSGLLTPRPVSVLSFGGKCLLQTFWLVGGTSGRISGNLDSSIVFPRYKATLS